MSDMDMVSDMDIDSDVDVDMDCDVSADFDFEDLDTVDDLDDDSFDEANELGFAEIVEDAEISEITDDFNDGIDELSEMEEFNDMLSLDDILETDTEEIEESLYDSVNEVENLSVYEGAYFDELSEVNQEIFDEGDAEAFRENLEYVNNTHASNAEQLEDEMDSVGNVFHIEESLEDIEDSNNFPIEDITGFPEGQSIVSEDEVSENEIAFSDIDTLIESTNNIDELNNMKDFLVNGDFSENNELDSLETVDEIIDFADETAYELSDEGLSETQNEVLFDTLSLEEISEDSLDLEAETNSSMDTVEQFSETESNPEYSESLSDVLQSSENSVEIDENPDDEDSPKVLTREITPEILESRAKDTEETLQNYRENLREYGVEEERIEEYIEQEREKINAEYESLNRGDISSNIYYMPNDWEEVASSLLNQDTNYEAIGNENVEQHSEELNLGLQEMNVDYNEIYNIIQRESLEQGFSDIHIDVDPERLDSSLENFNSTTWETLTIDEQKDTMENLADYVVEVIGFDNPPSIEYYNNEQMGDFGGYDASTNTLHVNEYMLYNSDEAADTIAHELWHAHQHECAMNPQNARDYQYQYNFENYIPPDLGQEMYESQLVETEARAFAAQFKDRLSLITGRSK